MDKTCFCFTADFLLFGRSLGKGHAAQQLAAGQWLVSPLAQRETSSFSIVASSNESGSPTYLPSFASHSQTLWVEETFHLG